MENTQKGQPEILERIEVKITGQVQGVFFRHETKKKAEELGLMGFVRNDPDGSVFIVTEGIKESLQKLIEWAKVGTELAEVQDVQVGWKEASGDFKHFEIK